MWKRLGMTIVIVASPVFVPPAISQVPPAVICKNPMIGLAKTPEERALISEEVVTLVQPSQIYQVYMAMTAKTPHPIFGNAFKNCRGNTAFYDFLRSFGVK